MIISSQWLNDYVSLEGLSSQEIAKTLTSLGLEVEGIKETALFDANIVLGKVLAAQKHPNADTLRLCQVDVGGKDILNIVCGAHNAREGIYVAVAQKGAVLPDGLKIKATKIRGEASEGMLCSERELGMSDDHDGIIEWKTTTHALGTPIRSFLQKPDAVMELNVTPNRSDCLSYIGVARDLAAKLKRPLKKPGSGTFQTASKLENINLQIENAEECTRFCAVLLKGVRAVESPLWLKQRLENSGMRSVNVLVDATNYVMLEYGQPIHAYDRRFVSDDTLKVCSGKSADFKTLDDADIKIQANDILICDAQKTIGLAGIMGGKNSEIKADTSEVLIEVAHFSMQKIRKTARRLGISSEASYRFERGVDIEVLPEVLKRVSSLIVQCLAEQGIKDVQVASQFYDKQVKERAVHKIALRLSRLRTMIADPVFKQETCINYLEALGFKLCDQKEERMLFEIPSWRNEILREIDLIEEVARLQGYDAIPYEVPRMMIAGQKEDPYIEFANKVKQSIATLGMNEVMTYPFTGKEDYEKLRLSEGHLFWPTVQVANALNEKQAFLQSLLLPSLLEALARNRNRGVKGVRLFEVARTFFSNETLKAATSYEAKYFLRQSRLLSAKAKAEEGRVIERETLAGLIDQPFTQKEWDREESPTTFYHGKELLSSLLKNFGLSNLSFVSCDLPFVHPHASAFIVFGRDRLGWVGELHPETANSYDLGKDVPVCFELDLEALFEAHEKQSYKIKQPARFPAVVRDLALLVEKDLSFRDFQIQLTKFPGKKHLNDARLFDLYLGESIGHDKKSFAVSCTFQSSERTLTDEEVDSELATLLSHLKAKLGAVQR